MKNRLARTDVSLIIRRIQIKLTFFDVTKKRTVCCFHIYTLIVLSLFPEDPVSVFIYPYKEGTWVHLSPQRNNQIMQINRPHTRFGFLEFIEITRS